MGLGDSRIRLNTTASLARATPFPSNNGEVIMSAYSEKIAKLKSGYFRVRDLEDVEGKELTRTIAFLVEDQEVFDEVKDVLHFADDGRQLQMNITNSESLIALLGDEPAEWPGHKITLYIGAYGKENKPCIRLKLPGTANGNGSHQKMETIARVAPSTPSFDDDIPF